MKEERKDRRARKLVTHRRMGAAGKFMGRNGTERAELEMVAVFTMEPSLT